jgi:hypothetical protein
MKKRSKLNVNLKIEAKIINCLNYLREIYDKEEPRSFDSVTFTKQFNISATLTTILKNLGIIIPQKNSCITITDKLNEITPRQIHIAINDYKTESRIRVKKRDDKIKAKELAKIQTQLQFENKQKLSGNANKKINNDALMELLRNAPLLPKNEINNMQAGQHFPKSAKDPQQHGKSTLNTKTVNKELIFKERDQFLNAYYPKQSDMYFPPIANKFEKPTVEEALSILKQAMKAELRETLRKEIIQELINKNI